MDTASTFAGRHVLAELAGIRPELLDDEPSVRAAVVDALVESGATVLDVISHQFRPHGLTMLALLAESHASIHTWPEHGAMFVDVFTCGTSADSERAVGLLAARLGAVEVHRETVQRGARRRIGEPLGPGLSRVWDLEQVLWAGRTAYQNVLIAQTAQGVTLFCDNERQSSQASQLVYHEALLVPALLLADRADEVLVIGSSEGVVSELALAAGARTVDHVDIDAECVRACARWLPYGYRPDALSAAERGAGPVRVHYSDGLRFLAEALDAGRRYDVVVMDLPDERPDNPDAQHNRLYETEFLRRAAGVLRPGGVLVGQAGCPTLWRNNTLLGAVRRFDEVFPTVVYYGSDEHEWSFLIGSPTPVADPVEQLVRRLPALPYRPETLDADALRRGAVPPRSTRD
jgi:spermidine synthase